MSAMNCDEARTMLAAYADGELSSLENEAIIAHLARCGRCRQTVRDQQRVQHVLDSYQPPPVDDDAWNGMARRLRSELAGKGEPLQLKTRPRIEGLDPTPVVPPTLAGEEPPRPVRTVREVPAPTVRTRAAVRPTASPMMTTVGVRPRRVRSSFGWVAHLAGAAAAAAVVALGLASLWMHAPPPLESDALARQGDVTILAIETDANYSLILRSGDTSDVVTLRVQPDESST